MSLTQRVLTEASATLDTLIGRQMKAKSEGNAKLAKTLGEMVKIADDRVSRLRMRMADQS